MKILFARFIKEAEGQDLIEYALLAGLIAIIALVAVTNAGTAVNSIFTTLAASLTSAAS